MLAAGSGQGDNQHLLKQAMPNTNHISNTNHLTNINYIPNNNHIANNNYYSQQKPYCTYFLWLSSLYERQGRTAFRIPAICGNIARPARAINSLSQVMAVNWIKSSDSIEKKKKEINKCKQIFLLDYDQRKYTLPSTFAKNCTLTKQVKKMCVNTYTSIILNRTMFNCA